MTPYFKEQLGCEGSMSQHDTPEAVPPLVAWANSLTISMDEHTRRVNEVRSDAILQVQKIGADYQRLMGKHNALHINALASRQRVAELEAEVQEQARLNGMGAERELALMAQVSRLEAERDQLRAELEKVRWQPIETAPQDMTECVVVRWVDGDGQEHQDFDYTEDGCWVGWHEHAEHVEMIGGHGVSYTPPYQHYMPLPAAPTPPNADQKGQ